MKAAIGLEVTGAIGQDLVRTRQAAAVFEPQPRSRIRLHEIGVDALVNNADTIMTAFRILGALPFGRALPPIGRFQPQKVDPVARPQARCRVGFRRIFRIEIDVGPAGSIEKFKIAEQRSFRPNVLQVKNFSPAIVADHDVGHKSVAIEPVAQFRHLRPVDDATFQLAQKRMCTAGGRRRPIFELADAVDPRTARLRDKAHVMPGAHQVAGGVHVLAREVLVNEQKLHCADL